MHAIFGISVSGDDTALIQRSLAHMSLRYEQQSNNAKTLLTWLKEQPQFAQVLHPSDKAAPGHQYWQEICSTGKSAGLV
ncbi:PLP-dependent transferase, partial [Klebsiella pneumoniae]|uniref:PLP-dependent transferase n=1 Tax=Klebsiella pneumoniae TaxID=573 RepID=UPI0021DF6DA9